MSALLKRLAPADVLDFARAGSPGCSHHNGTEHQPRHSVFRDCTFTYVWITFSVWDDSERMIEALRT